MPSPTDRPAPGPRPRWARHWRPWQWAALVVAASMLLTALILAVLIGLLVATKHDPDAPSAEALFNALLVGLVALSLPLIQRGCYRWFWHAERRIGTGPLPAMGTEPTDPPPKIGWPLQLRLRHAAMQLAGMGALWLGFAPLGHQAAITAFLARFGLGSAAMRGEVLFLYLPLVALIGLGALLTQRQAQRAAASASSANGGEGANPAGLSLLLRAEANWLSALATALVMAAFICRAAGKMVLAYF